MKHYLLLLLILIPLLSNAQWNPVNTNHLRFTYTGNVGIGTALNVTPSDKLHVIGNVRADQFYSTSGIFNVPSNLLLNTNGQTRMTLLNSNGFLGIGVTTPLEQLHINGSIRGNQSGAIRISSGFGTMDFGAKSSSYGNIDTDRTAFRFNKKLVLDEGIVGSFSGSLSFQVAGYQALTILSGSGNVGIGTTLSNNDNNYKLAVNGKIGAKEVQVETNSSTWPDYVFNPSYKLLSLREVESFIALNNHLPEVPSAAEINAHGHKLGEMDVILLKKLEEVTLYLIQLQKENEALKNRLSALEAGK
jgi:hypothetical protein